MGENFLMPGQQEQNISPSSDTPGLDRKSGPAQDTSMQPAQTVSDNDQAPSRQSDSQRIPYWLQQAERFLRVIVRIYLGLLVCFAPWYPPAWDANPLFSQSPSLLHFITNGAVRGVVSGLGVLNLWIALREAIGPAPDQGPH
jgi:hypothetical protein